MNAGAWGGHRASCSEIASHRGEGNAERWVAGLPGILGRRCRGLETVKEHLSAALLGAFTLAGIFMSAGVLRLGPSPASLAEVGNLTLETGLLAAYCIPPTAIAYRFWFLPAFGFVERRRPTQLRRYLHLGSR